MLSIIFLILKILGILLLILLLLILFFAVVVLFVPVRYRLTASRYEKLKGDFWFPGCFGESACGFSMMDGRSPGARFCGFGSLKNSFGLLRKRMTESSAKRPSRRKLGGRKRRREKGKKNGRKPSGRKLDGWMRGRQSRSGRRNRTGWGRKKQSSRRFPRKRKGRKEIEERLRATELSPSEDREKEEPDPSGPSAAGRRLFWRLMEIVKRFIRKLIGKISGFFRNFHQSVKRLPKIWTEIKNKLADGRKSFERMREILTNEENREVFRLLVSRGKKLFRHVRPKKIKGKLQFGFSDPYRTGQVLTAISPFYGLYAKELELIPDFEHEVLKGEISVKGRIRMGVVLWTGSGYF